MALTAHPPESTLRRALVRQQAEALSSARGPSCGVVQTVQGCAAVGTRERRGQVSRAARRLLLWSWSEGQAAFHCALETRGAGRRTRRWPAAGASRAPGRPGTLISGRAGPRSPPGFARLGVGHGLRNPLLRSVHRRPGRARLWAAPARASGPGAASAASVCRLSVSVGSWLRCLGSGGCSAEALTVGCVEEVALSCPPRE